MVPCDAVGAEAGAIRAQASGGGVGTVKIAIIGGSGFIGTRLVRRLVKAGHEPRIVDIRKSTSYPELWHHGDVRQTESLREPLRGCSHVINLAAVHRDDVRPLTLYTDVNVDGARNVCAACAELGIKSIVFTSSVAVFGFAPRGTDESGPAHPFNEYGRTKLAAELVYREWQQGDVARSLFILRPTVVFGENNRGNVYNLIRLILSHRFFMVGSGKNIKSMAYVENVAAFLEHALTSAPGAQLSNYVDKPDLDMNEFVACVRKAAGLMGPIGPRIPYPLGYAAGICADIISRVSGHPLAVSSLRIKKFCSDTQFGTRAFANNAFVPPCSLKDALERTVRHEIATMKSGTSEEIFEAE
jgi:GlcNAc-P-P-Und epimerase